MAIHCSTESLDQAGVPLLRPPVEMGHESIRLTHETYGHWSDEMGDRAANLRTQWARGARAHRRGKSWTCSGSPSCMPAARCGRRDLSSYHRSPASRNRRTRNTGPRTMLTSWSSWLSRLPPPRRISTPAPSKHSVDWKPGRLEKRSFVAGRHRSCGVSVTGALDRHPAQDVVRTHRPGCRYRPVPPFLAQP